MLVNTSLIFALPETRPDPSASTTRPFTSAPFAAIVWPPTTIGSARLAVKSSPALFVAVLIGLINSTVISVPSGTANILGAAGAAGADAADLGAFGGAAAGGAGLAGAAETAGSARTSGAWSVEQATAPNAKTDANKI